MREVGVVSVARSDYGLYLPLLRRIQADHSLQLRLIVSGMHLSPEYGQTINAIQDDGFEVSDQVDMLVSSDQPVGTAKSMGLGILGFAQIFSKSQPDVLVVLGDRFEMFCAALAALPYKIPVAHIHGGEVTESAIDDALRHSMTKLSHLHFVSTPEYAERVHQLGEAWWRITVSGAVGLDNLSRADLLTADEIESRYDIDLTSPPLLVTFHPVTLEAENTKSYVAELLAALELVAKPVVFTMSNADSGGRLINEMLKKHVEQNPRASMVDNFGIHGYFSIMAISEAMVGNSSSGIIEAASFELPVVNIGNRQLGRVKGPNVIDCEYDRDSILNSLRKALSPDFRASLKGMNNPYGSGGASDKIFEVLKKIPLNDRLLIKEFVNISNIS